MEINSVSLDPGRKIRIALACVTATLLAVGVVMIYSASAIYADQVHGDSMYFLKKHLMFLVLGIVAALGVMVLDLNRIRHLAFPFLALCCLALCVVGLWSDPIGGARRWLKIGTFTLQPSEFAKLALIIYLAHRIDEREFRLTRFKEDLMPLIWPWVLVCALVFLGRDFGTTVVMSMVFLILLFLSGISLKYFAWLFGSILPLVGLAILIEPYRVTRVLSFINPWADIRNTGFQLYQSLLAIGSGGFGGVGLGQSQQKLFYLPAAHTDFIFAIIGEEMGFVGAGFVILLFLAFTTLCLMIFLRAKQPFKKLLGLGLMSLVVIEASVNIGVSLGVLPTKGLALPFISYGGSSLMVKMMLIGLLLNIANDKDLYQVSSEPEP